MRKYFFVTLILTLVAAVVLPGFMRNQPLPGDGKEVVVDKRQAGRTAVLSLHSSAISKPAIGNGLSVELRVDDGGSKLRTATVSLVYPSDLLRYEQAAAASGSCATSPTISHRAERGSITITCAALAPTNSQVYALASLRFTVIGSGDALLSIQQSESALTVKGAEREALKTTQTLNVSVGTGTQTVAVFSRTHPITQSCSTSSSAELTWLPVSGIKEYRYSWSESPTTAPTERTTNTKLTLPVKPGAIHYFAIAPVSTTLSSATPTRYRVASCE